MTRQEKLNEIANSQLQKAVDGYAYSSKFIIPIAHNFYENKKKVFSDIEDLGWTILNKKDKKIRQFDAYNIKQYIYDNMIPNTKELDDSFIKEFSSTVLTKDIKHKLFITKNKNNYEIILESINLWIFEKKIGFLVLNLKSEQNYSLDEYSNIHFILKQFKFVNFKDKEDGTIEVSSNGYVDTDDIIEYLLFKHKAKLFLNITKEELKETPIYQSSTNAKFIVGMQIDKTKFSDNTEIEDSIDKLDYDNLSEIGILDEIPYFVATASKMKYEENKSYINSESYIAKQVNDNALNIWKYSSGIAVYDSCAFIGLKDDGGPVVSNVNTNFYFIYILNLYVYFKIKDIEHKYIDKNFESSSVNFWYRKLQKLKNQFFSKEIGIKFQENEVHKMISKSLKIESLLNEVKNNLVTSKEIVKDNIGIYIAFSAFIVVNFISNLFEDPLKEIIINNPLKSGLFIVLVGGVIIGCKKANCINKLREKFKF